MDIISKGFKIFFWNTRSLYNKLDPFKIILDNYMLQIFCMNETWSKEKIPDSLMSVKGYDVIRQDRVIKNPQVYVKRGGGIATYVKEGSDFKSFDNTPFSISNVDLECSTLLISSKCTRPMYIINIYRPPNGNLDNFYKIITEQFSGVFTKLYNQIINSGEYPKEWEIATVIPFPKIENATSPNDLRPISLLPLLGKILEHLLH